MRYTEADPFSSELTDTDALTIQTAAAMPTERAAFKLIDQTYGTGTLARHAAASTAMCRVRDGHPTIVGSQVVLPPGTSVLADATETRRAPERAPEQTSRPPAAHSGPYAQPLTQARVQPNGELQARAVEAFWSLPARSIETLVNLGYSAPLPDGMVYARDTGGHGMIGVRDLKLR